ncbi:MAG TPA: fibronectin type III domain-containing protein, partial [Lacipirellulaceae bacterium]
DNPVRPSTSTDHVTNGSPTDKTVRPTGEWTKIASDVSDAEVQYRPLFNDEQAEPGARYWYRVTARNPAGESPPSNVVGPVAVQCRTLVDECRDVAFLDAIEGIVTIAIENARTVQEDCHRFALRPGAAVTYRVPTAIEDVRIFSFVRDADAEPQVSVSADGQVFQPLDVRRTKFDAGQTVYGYLTPVLIETNVGGRGTYLKVALPPRRRTKSETADANDSAAPLPAPVEISRVEIDYDKFSDGEAAGEVKSSGKATPLNGSIFVDGTQPVSATLTAIDKAADRGERRLSVCVTIHVDLTEDFRIKTFGRIDRASGNYHPFDESMHDRLKDELRQVFARMRRNNMEIVILPHIDSGGRVQTWRNWVDFDPLVNYGDYSYEQLMIDSIATALAEVGGPTKVEMALSGEMGTSLFRYPASYREIVRGLRKRDDLPQLKIGISLNHGGISGQGNPTGVADIRLNQAQRAEMQKLIDDCDFVGMSFYRPVSLPPTSADFVRGIEHFMSEFHDHGLVVPTSKPLHFSEVGIGGGHDEMDTASDPAKAVETPWSGSGDPRINPWKSPAMEQLRRDYHTALLQFLSKQPARWHVSAAFFWGTGSWDPLGMRHPEFADPMIASAVQAHNLEAEKAR